MSFSVMFGDFHGNTIVVHGFMVGKKAGSLWTPKKPQRHRPLRGL
jgi:hypothetical protein